MKKTLLFCLSVFCIAGNLHAQTTWGNEININLNTGANPYVIASGQLNMGDTDIDIVIGTFSGGTIEWYRNELNSTAQFAQQTNIATSFGSVGGVHIADLDPVNGNGNDVIATSYTGDKVVWFQNDGTANGGFGAEQEISNMGDVDGAGQVTTADINNDGHLDVIVVVYGNDGATDRVVWYAGNSDGTFASEASIYDAVNMVPAANNGPGNVSLKDIDEDGDLDALIGSTDSGNIEILYNQFVESGTSTVSWVHNVANDLVDSGNTYLFVAAFADYDNDFMDDMMNDNEWEIIKTDIDNVGTDNVAWYKKNDGTGMWDENLITISMDYPGIIGAPDLNQDGYPDIVVTNGATVGDDVIWFESDGTGGFLAEAPISVNQKQVFGMTFADFDNDGDVDLATVDYQDNDLNWFPSYFTGETLGITTENVNTVRIFPNPTTDELNFRGINKDFEVSVYDIIGKEVLKTKLSYAQNLDVSELNNGVYILKLEDQNKTFKFIKE